MRLFTFWRSMAAFRVRMALSLKAMAVPTLVDDDGSVVTRPTVASCACGRERTRRNQLDSRALALSGGDSSAFALARSPRKGSVMQTRRRQGSSFRAHLSEQQANGLEDVSTGVPFAALAATTNSMIHTQRVMSLMWLDIGSEIAGHATRSIDLALRSFNPTVGLGRPPDAAARELLASQLSLTRHVIERVAETGRDIADVWGRFPERMTSADAKSAAAD